MCFGSTSSSSWRTSTIDKCILLRTMRRIADDDGAATRMMHVYIRGGDANERTNERHLLRNTNAIPNERSSENKIKRGRGGDVQEVVVIMYACRRRHATLQHP